MRSPAPAVLAFTVAALSSATAQAPTGLAAAALRDSSFRWVPRVITGFRVNFLADSYPARHQDSLLARLGPALAHAQRLLDVQAPPGPIDVFFLESRDQMARVIGGSATGFAQPSARAVFLVTNPDWRAFERHEIAHVVAGQAWGPAAPGMDWLVEGLAQAADGRCGGHSNADVVVALTARRGWIPLPALLNDFRRQPDLRAYLQAAAFVDYLLHRFGPHPLQDLWSHGATAATQLVGESLSNLELQWRAGLESSSQPTTAELNRIEAIGCG